MIADAGADPIAEAWSGKPDILALQQEFEDAITQSATTIGDISRIARAEDIRYQRWEGQSHDGLRWQDNMGPGREARPYDGAPDTRIPLADDIVNLTVATLMTAFWGARMNPKPTHISQLTVHEAAELKALVNWMQRGVLFEQLVDDAELTAQVANTVGYVTLKPGWCRREALVAKTVTMEELQTLNAQLSTPNPQAGVSSVLSELIANEETEEAAAEMVAAMLDIDPGDAKSVVKQLREQPDEEAEYHAVVLVENRPDLKVLIPWIDFIAPVEMTKVQRARVLFDRDYYSTAEIEQMARERDWPEAFVKAVIQTAGQTSDGQDTTEKQADQNMRMIELVTSYQMQVDSEGVAGIFCTTFSPNIKPSASEQLYAEHYLLDYGHGKYPFVIYQTEVTGKRPSDARGIPQRLATQQMEMKRQRDAVLVFTELSTVPPLRRLGARASKLPVQLGSLAIINMTRPDEWSWFNPPPGRPETAFQVEEMIRREAAHSHGVPVAGEPPAIAQVMQQKAINRWLMAWGQVFWQLAALCYQYLSVEELTDILGHPPLLTMDKVMKHTMQLYFDARALDNSWVKEMVAQIAEILQTDSAGVIDHAKLVQILLGYIDPTMADEVAMDKQGAAQKVFKDVRDQVLQVMNGNEAEYTQNDPTAKMKLQFLQQVVQSNPDYLMQLHPRSPQRNERKAALMEKYAKNLQQSVVQQQNKLVGRLGVKPGAE